MKIGLLGPLELTADGKYVDLSGARPRTVLALLALNADRPVPSEQLVDALWGEAPPRTARTQVQYCISALRRTLAAAGRPDAITTWPSGYQLNTADGELDLALFTDAVEAARDLAAQGRLADASEQLGRGLSQWRGPALMGVESESLRRAATLLEERRLAAVEERARIDLALGRHHEIIGELRAAAEEQPLREGLHAHLMLALYRAGRQIEALDVYRSLRELLVRELGIEPGKELQELETAVLRRDPRLDPGSHSPHEGNIPRQLPAGVSDFTGREDSVSAAMEHLLARPGGKREEEDRFRAVRVMGISGQEGVGKTSLAIHVAHRVRAEFPDGQLYADLHGTEDSGAANRVLAGFLRALGVVGTAVPDDPEEQRATYRSLLADRRVLVVLDEAPDESLVRDLLPAGPGCALLVTSRARLAGVPGLRQLHLDVLDEQRALELLGRIVGHERVRKEQPAAVALVALCGGLPLALRIVGARLAGLPHWPLDRVVRRLRDENRALDELSHGGLDLRERLTHVCRSMDPEARRLLALLALVRTGGFGAWTAAALLGTDLVTAEDALEGLLRAQLVDVVAAGELPPLYQLHDLVRVFAGEQLSSTRSTAEQQAALHRVLGARTALAQEAHRRDHGGHPALPHGTAHRWRLSPDDTADVLRDPAHWWRQEQRAMVAAVDTAAELGLDELCWELALACTARFELWGATEDWRMTAERALSVCRRSGNRLGTAAALYALGTLHLFEQRLDDAARCLHPAAEIFQEAGGAPDRAPARLALAELAALRAEHTAAVEHRAAALAAFRAAGDRVGEAYTLTAMAEAVRAREPDLAGELLHSALAMSREADCLRAEARVLGGLGEWSLRTGHHARAQQTFSQALRLSRGLGDRRGEAHALDGIGRAHAGAGRAARADAVLLQALVLARQVGERVLEGRVLYTLGCGALATGGRSVARAHLVAALEVFTEVGVPDWVRSTEDALREAGPAPRSVVASSTDGGMTTGR